MTPSAMPLMNDYMGGLVEGHMGESPPTSTGSPGGGVTRSRTLPARPRARGEAGSNSGEDRQRNVLKKGRGGRAHPPSRKDDSG